MGIPLTTIAISLQLASVMEGKHSVDIGMLILPILMEFIMLMADEVGIKYDNVLTFDLIENKLWKRAYNILKNAFKLVRNNRDIKIRVAGCCLCLNRIEEGNYLLNPQELYQEEKDKFLILFPEFKSHLSKV